MDSEHTCILRHDVDAMMFARYSTLHVYVLRGRAKTFQALLQPLGSRTLGLPHLL